MFPRAVLIIFCSFISPISLKSIESPTVFKLYFVCKWDFCVCPDPMDSKSRLACTRTQQREKRGEFISSFTVKFISFNIDGASIYCWNIIYAARRKLLQSAVPINNKLASDINEKNYEYWLYVLRFAGSKIWKLLAVYWFNVGCFKDLRFILVLQEV